MCILCIEVGILCIEGYVLCVESCVLCIEDCILCIEGCAHCIEVVFSVLRIVFSAFSLLFFALRIVFSAFSLVFFAFRIVFSALRIVVLSAQSLHESENETRPAWPSSFNLFVMLRNFVCKIGEDADILMNIFDAKEGKFIRYNHVVFLSLDWLCHVKRSIFHPLLLKSLVPISSSCVLQPTL